MRQRNEKGLQSTTRKDLRRAKTKRHNVPDSRRALHMRVLERDFGIRAAYMQHDCATCASMLRDAVTAAQSRFLATKKKKKKKKEGEDFSGRYRTEPFKKAVGSSPDFKSRVFHDVWLLGICLETLFLSAS